jgi:hypothetical protein
MFEPTIDKQIPRVDRDAEGRPKFVHACTEARLRRTVLPLSRDTGWWWADNQTLMPSIHCQTCGTHGWWRNGLWEGV